MDNLFHQADKKMKDGRYEEALELYNRKILDSPNNALAYQGAAFALFRLKAMEEAIEMSRKALSLDSQLAFAHVILAEAYDELGEIVISREEAKTGYQLDPESAEVLGCYGAFLLIDRKYEEAIPVLEKAVKINPTSYNIYNNLAAAYSHKKDKGKVFEQAREMYRLRPSLYTTIGLVIAFLNSKYIFNILSVVFIITTIGAFTFKNWILLIFSFAYIAVLVIVGLVLMVQTKRKTND